MIDNFTAPTPLPVPQNAPIIAEGQAVIGNPTGAPLIWRFDLGSYRKVTFSYVGQTSANLGIYGPNPAVLGIGGDGKTTGRMRAPKQGDAPSGSCTGNFTAGTYYLVVRQGENSPPTGTVSVHITTGFPWPW